METSIRALCVAAAVGMWAAGCGKVVKIDYDAGMFCEPLPPTGLPGPAAAVWLGDGYAAVWSEARDENTDLYFGRLDAAGALEGATTRITEDPGVSRVLALVAIEGGHAVLYEDDRDPAEIHHLYVATLDEEGALAGDEVAMGALWGTDVASGDTSSAVLVWDGTHLATAWIEDRDETGDPEVYFARWAPAAAAAAAAVRVNTSDAASRDVSLVGTGNGYGVAWSDTRDAAGDGNSEIYALRLDAGGERVTAEDQRVTEDIAFSVRPSLAWSGDELGLAWVDNRTGDSELYFTRLDAAGLAVGDVLRVTEDPSPVETKETPALVHDGDAYALAWSDRRDLGGTVSNEVFLARIGEDAARIGAEDVRVTDTATDTRVTDILRSGETFTLLGEELAGEARDGWIATVCPDDM